MTRCASSTVALTHYLSGEVFSLEVESVRVVEALESSGSRIVLKDETEHHVRESASAILKLLEQER